MTIGLYECIVRGAKASQGVGTKLSPKVRILSKGLDDQTRWRRRVQVILRGPVSRRIQVKAQGSLDEAERFHFEGADVADHNPGGERV